MSLIQNIASALPLIGNIFGKQNASQLSDCIGAAGKYGAQTALAMYPQCAPYAAQMNVPIGTPNPRIPATAAVAPPVLMAPPVPQAMPGGSPTYQVPATVPQTLPVAYTAPVQPAMTLPSIVPKLAAPVVTAAKTLLPVLNTATALASGFQLIGNLWYTAGGMAVGRKRKRRRLNPLNYRAAKRAARRLCAVRDLTAQIERAIPTRPARSRRPVYAFQRKRKTCR
jgi:hypothetical protein